MIEHSSSIQIEHDPQTYAIIGASMEVHRVLGGGFLELVYQEALAHELRLRRVPFEREVQIPVFYKEVQLSTAYRADFVCFGSVVVETKSISSLGKIEIAQTINYLKATKIRLGLLINFGGESLQFRRLVSD